MAKQWHAVYVASRQEKKVNEALAKKGVESYLPLVKTMRNWSDRKKLVEFPLIPGYIFVHLDISERLTVLETRGIVNFVKSYGKIGVVYDSEIENIKQLVALGYHLDAFPVGKMEKGDRIKITSGPLKNLEGIITDQGSEEFFNVILEGIGYNVRVKLPSGVLKKAI
jgi:transcriptional antiterminator RfaH